MTTMVKAVAKAEPNFIWRLFFVCIMVSIFVGVVQGQDANWDLKNYHYYSPHAWVHDRYGVDIAPAQLQTWHSPFADLPYYWMAQFGFHSIILTGILSLPAGISIFLLILIAQRVSPNLASVTGVTVLILLSITGAAGARTIGTTMSEWHLSALLLGAVLGLLRQVEDGWRYNKWTLFAGLLGGCAVGLKLTSAPFAVGLAAMLIFLPGLALQRAQRLVVFGVGGIVGFVIFFAPWGLAQYERFGNPFFPYFNDIFKSSLLPLESFRDVRFGAKSAIDVITLPARLVWNSTSLVTEPTMRDSRLFVTVFAILVLLWPRRKEQVVNRELWIAIAAFFFVSYVLWVTFFGIYRYALALELFAGVIFAASILTLPLKKLSVILIASALLIIATTRTPSWGRVSHGAVAVHSSIPKLPPGTMVVIASNEPLGYIVPSFPIEIRTVAVINNFMALHRHVELQQQAIVTVAAHEGPIYRLLDLNHKDERHYNGDLIELMFQKIGFTTDFDNCLPISSGMQQSGLALCRVVKPATAKIIG